jgi:hypothetical protein
MKIAMFRQYSVILRLLSNLLQPLHLYELCKSSIKHWHRSKTAEQENITKDILKQVLY